MTLETTAQIELKIDFRRERSGFGVAPTYNTPRIRISSGYSDGSGSAELNTLWHKTVALTGAGSTSFDLQGALSGIVGEAGVSFDNIKGMMIRNKGSVGSGHTVALKPGASNGWTSLISGALRLPRGTNLFIYTPDAAAWDVSGTNKTIQAVGLNDGSMASFDLDVLFFGNST